MDQSRARDGLRQLWLQPPTVADARRAVRRRYRWGASRTWRGLLDGAGLTGQETDRASLTRLLVAMSTAHPALALTARSLVIRSVVHEQLGERPEPCPAPAPGSAAGSAAGPERVTRSPRRPARLPRTLAQRSRLDALAGYDLFHPGLRAELDRLCRATATELDAPVAMVNMVLDLAQFAAGSHGLAGWPAVAQGSPVEWSFCTQVVGRGTPYVVTDARTDPRQRDNPLVVHGLLVSYAGVPLTTDSGWLLGAHCVGSSRPRDYSRAELDRLRRRAVQVISVLERHRLGPR